MSTAEKIYEHVKALPEPVALEVLDFVEFVESRSRRAGTEVSSVGPDRLRRMRAACGVWRDRDDLPDLRALRGEWGRSRSQQS
jgi:hypothetical protein